MSKFTVTSLVVLLLAGFVLSANAMEAPTNLTALAGDEVVYLEWDPPMFGQWIQWDSGINNDAIGTGGAAQFKVAQRFAPADLQDLGVGGSTITEIRFYPHEASASYTINVWVGGSATQPGTLVVEQAVTDFQPQAFNDVVLNNPVVIDDTQELWFGYSVNTPTGYPAGCDAGPAINGYGNMMYFNNVWDTLLGIEPTLNYNWNLAAFVDEGGARGEGRLIAQGISQDHPIYNVTDAELTLSGSGSGQTAATRNRELLGFNVYRDNEVINDYPVLVPEYADYEVENGVTYTYYVTAVYDAGESDPSNSVDATPQGVEIVYPAPMNLTATLHGDDNVLLSWEEPEFGDWIYWDSGQNAGNAIGTGGEAQFKVAQRFSPANIADLGVGGRFLTEVRFFPAEANCTYEINVWTGGSATQPATLQLEQPVPNPVINEWNTVVLDEPVFISPTQELWFGYAVNTQTGYPAGCDEGPAIDGYGNMMYMNNSWSTLLNINDALNYNWNIAGFAGFAGGRSEDMIEISRRSDYVAPQTPAYPRIEGEFKLNRISSSIAAPQQERFTRSPDGYRVYRNDIPLVDLGSDELSYLDEGLESGYYIYYVTALYGDEESDPSNSVGVNTEISTVLFDDFEGYPDFALQFAPWTLIDMDQSPTYGFGDVTFPNEESPMAFMVFNPSQTTPALDFEAYSGDKMAASFAAVSGPNNDWMITPQLQLGENSTLTFWARSYTATYGLERMRVGVSTQSMLPATFNIITEGDFVEVPIQWTQYTFDLSEWDNQNVWLAINCVSDDAFIFFVDDFHVQSVLEVSVDENVTAPVRTALGGNYPNPFNPETTIAFTVEQAGHVSIDIFNVKGQRVATIVDGVVDAGNHTVVWNGRNDQGREAGSGIYFYRMKSGSYSSTKKMIMMK